ncbi:hypothetical protein [Puniceibacterium sediminis]|nr:hypothetical protein [Puniceibacterium sediminis]
MTESTAKGPSARRPRYTLGAALLLASVLSLPFVVIALVQLLF